MTQLAVMQPTFLPWIGYFAMMDRVDLFVFLDDVQCSRQSWQTRNRIKTAQGTLILTVPCKRGLNSIASTPIDNSGFHQKLMCTIKQSYAKAPCKEEVIALLERVFGQQHTTLGNLNRRLIDEIAGTLGINTPRIATSELDLPPTGKGERLLQICTELGADTYLSPQGALDYLQHSNPFESGPTKLRFFAFKHPEYAQLHGTFEPYMSVVDALANIGVAKTMSLMRSGVMPDLTISELTAQA